MGETEEKENGPNEAQEGEEPKETDKMLNKEDGGAKKSDDATTPEAIATETAETVANSPENGEEIVKIAEEPKIEQTKETVPVTAEGREVKPKKIPIGGIKMPGFFTRGIKGAANKNEGDGADGELLETKDNKPTEDNINNENRARINFLSNFRIRNPFKRQVDQQKLATENGNADQKAEDEEKVTIEEEGAKEKVEGEEHPQKRRLLNAIRLPQISNIIPKRLRGGVSDDVELGNGPHNKAGLASMETLDDSTKDPESKDTTDRAAVAKPADEDLETVKLDSKDEKSQDKAEEAGAADKPKPWLERIRSYQCSIDDIAIVAGILVFLLLVGIICAFTFTGKTELSSAPIKDGRYVEAVTGCGPVEGLYDDGAFVFRGIPYAVSPLDENRWMPSRPIDDINYCWNGTFKAHNSTPVCLQLTANGTIDGVEDCLTLDVVTPHVRYDNPLPVVVLIGAESFSGDSPGKMRPSKRYARARDVIFVRPNFRVGAFGFLALDALSRSTHPPRSGNYGLSDIITALKWIKINIVNFGGDPNSVTLFGHRAGATLVSAIVASPQAKSLFHRSWISSGSANFPGRSLQEYERQNQAIVEALKCRDAACLRNQPGNAVLDAVPDTWRHISQDLPARTENATNRHEYLVLDGEFLQESVNDVLKRELGPLKMVIGTTAHESHSEKLWLKHKEWTKELVRQHVEESFIGREGLTDEALKRYGETYQGLVAMISDIRTVCPLLTVARSLTSVPFYVVTQPAEPLNIADVDADVQAIFGRYEPKTPEQRRYVSAIQQLFYHYVSHGEMKQYEPRRPVFNIGQDALPAEDYANCDFWIKKDIVPRFGRVD